MSDAILRDRVAFVTGAGRGIGRRIAVGLGVAGAHVVLLARSQHELAGADVAFMGGREQQDEMVAASVPLRRQAMPPSASKTMRLPR